MKLTADSTQELQQGLDQEVLLQRITNRIRQSLELEDILTATVGEIRSFLGTDRVMVYRFHSDGNGQVIAESIQANRLPSLLGLNFPEDDIPPNIRELFLKSRQRTIVNVREKLIGVSPLECPETREPLTSIDINYRPADGCHLQYLQTMGVQFSLAVPLVHNKQLWGLLIAHHAEPRFISDADLQFVQRVADQVSVAIAHAKLLSQAREQTQQEATVNRVATLLHAQPTPPLPAALEEVVTALHGCGGRLYLAPKPARSSGETYVCGLQPAIAGLVRENSLEDYPRWQEWIAQCFNLDRAEATNSKLSPRAIVDISDETLLESLIPAFHNREIRSLLLVPLQYHQQFLGYLTIFSRETTTETWWAGHFDPKKQQQQPRTSFEAWRESKTGQPWAWTTQEIELAQTLAKQFSQAIQQYQLYDQVQDLNAQLEHQVKERTEALQQQTERLQQSLELARILKQVTNQIRSTLELPTILQTIVQEVREHLNTERAIVYQFLQTWEGKVAVEAVTDPNLSILGQVYDPNCFPIEYTYQYQAGRVRAISNILEAGLSQCHVEFLQKIQVHANLVVPIRRHNHLWGLLIAHSCQGPRNWHEWELELLEQLGDQAAIAIHQAELYEQSCATAATAVEKARQLEFTVEELQRTQAQLIQTEKMSSLGQLVAGIAHEINNPVNFIYGNLSYAGDYAQELINLLELYQQEYPHPTPQIERRIVEMEIDYLIEDLPKTLSSMKVGAERIRQLVLSLRNFSRLDEAERKAVDVHEGLDSTLLILQHRLKEQQNQPAIELVKDYGNLPLVECYAGQLNQVFMNILSNAIDALEGWNSQRSPEQLKNSPSKIIIRTEAASRENLAHHFLEGSSSNAWILIRIIDNGPGMTQSVKDQIFNPFFTTKPVGKGTGLGLSICYQIVEKHGGKIEVTTQPEKGTEFTIALPVH